MISPRTKQSIFAYALTALAGCVLVGCPGPEPEVPDDIFGEMGEVAPWASPAQREALVAAVGQAEPGWPVLSMRKAERVVARSMARGAPLVVAERGTDLRHKASG